MNGTFSCAAGARRLAAAAIVAMLLIVSARPAVSADEQSANPQADNATVRGATVRGATVRGATVRGATVRGYLDAGEFGPAMDLARGAPTAAQRDAWLGQIAVAQAGLGAADPRWPPPARSAATRPVPTRFRGRRKNRWAGAAARAGRFRLADRPDHLHHPPHFVGGRRWPRVDQALPHRRDHRSAGGAPAAVEA